MEIPRHLVDAYQAALRAVEPVASESEKALYSLHSDALKKLTQLMSSGTSSQDGLALLHEERRLFGRSFLSGAHGELVEHAFNAVLSAAEAPKN